MNNRKTIPQPPGLILFTTLWAVAGLGLWALLANLWIRSALRLEWYDWSGLATGGLAALILALSLSLRRTWAWPAAAVYHLWLTMVTWTWAWLEWPYTSWVALLPPVLTISTWQYLIAFVLFGVGVGSLLGLYILYRARDKFGRSFAPRLKTCPTCGATQQGSPSRCPYCDRLKEHFYFLQPTIAGALRIPLAFGEGHWRVMVGRDNQLAYSRDGWIDEKTHPTYATVARRHIELELDPQRGTIMLFNRSNFASVLVNGREVVGAASIQIGDMLQLGDAEFVLGNPQFEPVVAYLHYMGEERRSYKLRFDAGKTQARIGRGPFRTATQEKNDLVLPDDWRGVSEAQATLIYDPEEKQFYICNDSKQAHTLRIEGEFLESGQSIPLAADARISFHVHTFIFSPILYQPFTEGGVNYG